MYYDLAQDQFRKLKQEQKIEAAPQLESSPSN